MIAMMLSAHFLVFTGLEILMNSASPNAFYDSAANQLPLSHNPAARSYKSDALDWIGNKSSTSMMWFSGGSSSLTSSIARSTAEFCGSVQQKKLLTTFFFSKSDPSRNSAKHFVASLAYGIIQSIPISRTAITQAVEDDPLMFSGSIEKQFEKLIFEPLNQLDLTHQDSALPYLIIIDAFDECEGASARTQILHLFERFYTARLNGHQRNRPPWKILLTSKPDQTISEVIGRLHSKSIASHNILPEERVERDFLAGQSQEKSVTESGSSKTPVRPLPSRGLRLLSIGVYPSET